MSSLTVIRAAVRIDLKDLDPADERWTDAELDRHIEHALGDYSQVSPIEQKTTLQTTSGSRDIDVSSLTPRIRIVAIEFPEGDYPPAYVPFTLWGDALTLDLASAPAAVADASVFWHKEHSIGASATFPSSHDDLIVTGAGGYAALEWASFAANRLHEAGDDVWGRYMEFANLRLAAFRKALRELPEANRLRTGRFYMPQQARFRSQTTDPGPA